MNRKDEQRFESAARLLRVLGHPMRLAMVEALRERPWCVCQLADNLGLNKSAASKHLSLLKSVGIIDMERDGTQVNCSLAMPCILDMMYCANNFDAPPADSDVDADADADAERPAPACSSGCCTVTKE